MAVLAKSVNVCKTEELWRAFWIQAWDLALCKARCSGSHHALSLPEKKPICFLLCKCCCLFTAVREHRLFCGGRCSALSHEFTQPFSSPVATQQHIIHPAQQPRSRGGEGGILTLRCHCCSKLSPPPASTPAHHAQNREHQHQSNLNHFPPPKEIKFYLLVQKSIR